MGCACSKSLYEYSMDSSTEDLIKSYEQTQDSRTDCRKDNVLLHCTFTTDIKKWLLTFWENCGW